MPSCSARLLTMRLRNAAESEAGSSKLQGWARPGAHQVGVIQRRLQIQQVPCREAHLPQQPRRYDGLGCLVAGVPMPPRQ